MYGSLKFLRVLKKLKLLMLFFVSVSSSWAAKPCEPILDSLAANPEELAEESSLEILENLEARLQALRIWSKGADHSRRIEDLYSEVEEVIGLLGGQIIPRRVLEELQAQVAEVENFKREASAASGVAVNEGQNFVFSSKLLPELTIISPSQVYLFELQNSGGAKNQVLPVRFSDRVVSRLFKSKNKEDRAAALKLLKSIARGFVGPAGSNGIKRLNLNRDVLEVGFIGAQGSWRMGAYLHEGTLYVTHAVNSSSHGSTGYEQAFVNLVLTTKKANGHG